MVEVSNKHKSITVGVSSNNGNTIVTAKSDTAQYWSNQAHSFADQSKESAQDSKHYAELVNSYIEGFEDVVISNTNNIITTSNDCINQIAENTEAAIDSINSTKTTILNDIEFVADGEKKEIEELIDSGKDELKEAIGDVKVLTTLEIGDIGFTQMAIDESKGKRRALNRADNIIIQEQWVELTKRIKNTRELFPDLFCTESEWQAELAASPNGVCYKYVIDDEAGTIRLPKYPDYFDVSINTTAKSQTVSVYGTGKSLGMYNGSQNFGLSASGNAQLANTGGYDKTVGTAVTGTHITASTAWGVVKNASTSGLTGSVTVPAVESEKIKGTYFIQVATGAETEDNIINEIELNNPFFLGMSQYFETAPNNSSWLESEGQWNSKAVHTDYYDWLLRIYNGTEVVEGVSVKLVTEEYTDYDWVLNTADETFRLPLLNGSESIPSDKYIDLSSELTSSGQTFIAPANGWYTITMSRYGGETQSFIAISNLTTGMANEPRSYGGGSSTTFALAAWIYAKRGDIIKVSYSDVYAFMNNNDGFIFNYAQGNGSLYFYVGETVQNANLVNIGRIQETYTTKSMVDGRWIPATQNVLENVSMTARTEKTIDLSDYLPNDGYNYEVIIEAWGATGTTSGYRLQLNIVNELLPEVRWVTAITRTSSSNQASNIMTLPVGQERNFTIKNVGDSSETINIVSLGLRSYRRIGTNL